MKVTYYLPAHPSYFEQQYSQEEIDQAIADYDRMLDGSAFKSNPASIIPQEYRFMREPGKQLGVVFNSAGIDKCKRVPEHDTNEVIEQYSHACFQEFEAMVLDLKDCLESNRLFKKRAQA